MLSSARLLKGFASVALAIICHPKIEIKQCTFQIFYIIIILLMHGLKFDKKIEINTSCLKTVIPLF